MISPSAIDANSEGGDQAFTSITFGNAADFSIQLSGQYALGVADFIL
ncbi:MAG: hypothetical protein KAZ68_02805 [Candidatus Methylopumilus sp.]|nr:hypothetical protein [Candidatus Methylopumilus sp.]